MIKDFKSYLILEGNYVGTPMVVNNKLKKYIIKYGWGDIMLDLIGQTIIPTRFVSDFYSEIFGGNKTDVYFYKYYIIPSDCLSTMEEFKLMRDLEEYKEDEIQWFESLESLNESKNIDKLMVVNEKLREYVIKHNWSLDMLKLIGQTITIDLRNLVKNFKQGVDAYQYMNWNIPADCLDPKEDIEEYKEDEIQWFESLNQAISDEFWTGREMIVNDKLRKYVVNNRWSNDMLGLIGQTIIPEEYVKDFCNGSYQYLDWKIPVSCLTPKEDIEEYKDEEIEWFEKMKYKF
jgi:hypothetical protein